MNLPPSAQRIGSRQTTTGEPLLRFSVDDGRVRPRRRALSGVPSGETILGLDIRPANRQVYALSSASRLYTINVPTATATAVGTAPFTPALDGASFGFDSTPWSIASASSASRGRTCA